MDKLGFEIRLNNKMLCRAGLNTHHSVVTCCLGIVKRKIAPSEEIFLNIEGLNSDKKEHVSWFNENSLKENDEISIKIISTNFDVPKIVQKGLSPEEEIQEKINYFYLLKEELKDYLKD